MRAHLNTRDYEQISAYIDGQLSPVEQHKLEERLRRQPELQEALEDLTRTRALLRQAPRRRAPRNFTLTPAMVGDYKPRAARRAGWNLFPALSFASALAALALVASMLFQIWPGVVPAATRMNQEAAPANDVAATAPVGISQAQPEELPARAPGAPPPVINWGGSGATMAKEGVGGYGSGGGGDGTITSGMQGIFTDPAPGCPDGRCGGAPDTIYGMGEIGMGGEAGGGITLPPGSVESLPNAGIMAAPERDPFAAPTATPAPMGTSAPQGEAPAEGTAPEGQAEKAQDSAITGSGPILGVPAPDAGGEIYEQQYLRGLPEGDTAVEPSSGPYELEPGLFGLPRLLAIQILLALITLVTGGAAFLLWRRSR